MLTTRNFVETEFTQLHLDEQGPPPAALVRQFLAAVMALAQWLRDVAGSAGYVNSWWRSAEHNSDVGGASHSEHMEGRAADVEYPDVGLRELAQRVLEAIAAGTAPQFGQLIFYRDTGHVHFSIPRSDGRPNNQVLYSPGKDGNGTRIYQPLNSVGDLGRRGVPELSTPQVKRRGLRRSGSGRVDCGTPRVAR